MKKAGFFENFWYHHKWMLIITVSFVVIIAIGSVQILTRNKADLHIMYAGPVIFDENSVNSINEAFGSIPFGDGYVHSSEIAFIRFVYYSPEKQEELKAEAAESDQIYVFDNKFNTDEYSGFRDEIIAGGSVICILDRALYDDAAAQEVFLPLEEIYGGSIPKDVSDIAVDECGVLLADTKFARFYTVFSSLPDDTVIAVRKNSVMGGRKRLSSDNYTAHIEYFKSLLAFEYPEGYTEQ